MSELRNRRLSSSSEISEKSEFGVPKNEFPALKPSRINLYAIFLAVIFLLCVTFASFRSQKNVHQLSQAVEIQPRKSKEPPKLDGTGDIEDIYSYGSLLVQTHRYADALPYLEYAAKAGENARAFHALGELYVKGKGGVPRDYHVAFEMFREAAKLNHVPAFLTLAYFYEKAVVSEEPDLITAAHWYGRAADAEDPLGMVRLAILYRNGVAVRKNLKQSFLLLEKAAKMKDTSAMFELGNVYFEGLGVEKDLPKALHWYRETMKFDESNPVLFYNIARMYRFGLGTDVNMTKAIDFYFRAADMGHVLSAYELEEVPLDERPPRH